MRILLLILNVCLYDQTREREKKKSGLVTNRNTNEKNFLSRSVYLVLYNGERERERMINIHLFHRLFFLYSKRERKMFSKCV